MTSSKSFLYAFCLIVALAGVVVLAQAPKHKPPPPPPTTTRNSSVATTGPAGNATHRHHHGNGSFPHPHQYTGNATHRHHHGNGSFPHPHQHTGNATHRHHHGGNASHPHPHPHQHHANKTHLKISHCDKSIKNIATINSVEIKDCKGPACTFTRGQKYYIRVNFTMAQRCNKLNLNITGIISKRAVPFPIDDQELCKNCIKNLDSSDKCLLKKGSSYLFEYSMDVLKSFPPIALPVSFQVKCNEDKSVFCFMFPVRLV